MNNRIMYSPDFLIIGAGIIGLSIGRELQRRHPDAKVTIMDKEDGPGCHASGRNSGVLHSGIYYTADSLKARFTRDGNLAWQEYCAERSLNIDKCGKLIVPRDEHELQALTILEERG
ncbi:MAG: FAD-dependent oxidoreductase, partial [Desulfovermiculus sp.]